MIDGRLVLEADNGRGQGIVRFEFNHRPDHDPQRGNRFLGQGELGQQLAWNAFTGLVAFVQVVAE